MKKNGHQPPTNGALPAEAFDPLPRVAITLTDESTYLTRFDRQGNPSLTYPVAIEDIAQSFNRFGADTGLLPEHTLFWQQNADGIRIGIWLPPATRTLTFEVGRREIKVEVPLPGAVFVGKGIRYEIYAAIARPANAQAQLYRYPLPNVDTNGWICEGNVQVPKCAPDTIAAAAALFFESRFNLHLSEEKIQEQVEEPRDEQDDELDEAEGYIQPDDERLMTATPEELGLRIAEPPARKARTLLDFLKTLKGQAEFPAAQLVPECTLARVLKGAGR